MSKAREFLLIGGPRDGCRITQGMHEMATKSGIFNAPVPVTNYHYEENPTPKGPEVMSTAYFGQRLRGEYSEIIFYRHHSLTVDEALTRLFDRYPKENAEESGLKIKRVPYGMRVPVEVLELNIQPERVILLCIERVTNEIFFCAYGYADDSNSASRAMTAKPGDNGYVVFTQNAGDGFWDYFPEGYKL